MHKRNRVRRVRTSMAGPITSQVIVLLVLIPLIALAAGHQAWGGLVIALLVAIGSTYYTVRICVGRRRLAELYAKES